MLAAWCPAYARTRADSNNNLLKLWLWSNILQLSSNNNRPAILIRHRPEDIHLPEATHLPAATQATLLKKDTHTLNSLCTDEKLLVKVRIVDDPFQ